MSTYQKTPQNDRRSRHRSNINLPIKANILLHDGEADRALYNGMAKNISYTGMMCVVYGVEQQTYHKLVSEKPLMKIHMNVPDHKDSLDLEGQIIWIDYHPNAIPNDYCNIGLSFENLNPAENKEIIDMIREINKRPDTTY